MTNENKMEFSFDFIYLDYASQKANTTKRLYFNTIGARDPAVWPLKTIKGQVVRCTAFTAISGLYSNPYKTRTPKGKSANQHTTIALLKLFCNLMQQSSSISQAHSMYQL